MHIEVHQLNNSRREDFYRVLSCHDGSEWCNCVAWWTPTWDGWGEQSAADNRAMRERLFADGQYDGYLLYADGNPVGWCQCGPRDRLPKLCAAYDLQPDADMWALTCFEIAPEFRGRGLAHALLSGILESLSAQGVSAVQAFPRRGADMQAGEVWTGPEALFAKSGFDVQVDDPERPVYCKRF